MSEQFDIIYKGQPVTVREDLTDNPITQHPVYMIDLPGKTLMIEMGDDGFWKAYGGEASNEIQEIGQLIEEHDY